MATYKVIQDIEAEDKFVGPLSLKQFIFAMAGAFFGWLSVFSAAKFPFMMVFTVPVSLFAFFLAVPWSSTQPTEIWVLAKLRFLFKPKRRIWDQAGLQDLVTITAPKKIEKALTKNLSQKEVKSRLKALAETIDSRGWAVKHADLQQNVDYNPTSDRLINTDALPKNVPDIDVESIPDMFDSEGGAASAVFEHMITSKDQERKAQLISKMERARRGEPIDDSVQAPMAVMPPQADLPPVSAGNALDEKLLAEELKARKSASNLSQSKLHKIGPGGNAVSQNNNEGQEGLANDGSPAPTKQSARAVSPDILDLARNNDLNVATIARQANKPDDDDEVVISLH